MVESISVGKSKVSPGFGVLESVHSVLDKTSRPGSEAGWGYSSVVQGLGHWATGPLGQSTAGLSSGSVFCISLSSG